MKQTVFSLTLALVSFTSSLRAGFFDKIRDSAGRGMDYAKNKFSGSNLVGEEPGMANPTPTKRCRHKKKPCPPQVDEGEPAEVEASE